jgi:predicted permease
MLIAFGLSLAEQSIVTAHDRWPDTIVATAIKVAAMPAIAFLLGRYLFDLDSVSLLSVTVLAALPTAQNIFTFAQRYEVGETVARDTGLLTTILSVPALVVITLLL